MTQGREVTAVLLFAVGFLITQFNPVSLDFGWNTLVGLILVALFGALVTVAGMIEVRWRYLLPILALSLFDLSAVGLFLFALFGTKAADREEENMVKPNVMMINNAAFSSYTLFVLAAVLASYSAIQFQIPGVVSGFAVELLLPPPEECRLDYSSQDCIDARATLQDTLDAVIKSMIEPHEEIFRFVMAFVIFSTFQVLSSPLIVLATLFSKLLLRVMESANLLTKNVIQVEKLRFSA